MTNIGSSQSLLSGPSYSEMSSISSNMSNLGNLSTMTNIGSQSSNMSNLSSLSTLTNVGSQSSLMSNDSAIQVHTNLANLSLNNIQDTTVPTHMSQFLHASNPNLQSQISANTNANKLPPLPSLFGPNTNIQTPFTPAFQPQQPQQPTQSQGTDFSKYFQPATDTTTPTLFDPSQSSNQMIQNLVQQTISNHFSQQQNQSGAFNDAHGHSHDHSAHGHSHDSSDHGHSH